MEKSISLFWVNLTLRYETPTPIPTILCFDMFGIVNIYREVVVGVLGSSPTLRPNPIKWLTFQNTHMQIRIH